MLSFQAKKAINYILRLRKLFGFVEVKDIFKIFDATVTPMLCIFRAISMLRKLKMFKYIFVKNSVTFFTTHAIFWLWENVKDCHYVQNMCLIVLNSG